MNQPLNTADTFGCSISSAQRNKVLRNTYWLLAISLLPTVAGAWLGVATGITAAMSGMMGLVLFLGGAFGFIYAINKTKNSAAGVPVLLGFTFFMGLMISRLIAMVLGFSNGADLVMIAFGGTAAVFFAMASLATVVKRDLSGLNQWLTIVSFCCWSAWSSTFLWPAQPAWWFCLCLLSPSSAHSCWSISSASLTAVKPTTSQRPWRST